MIKAIYLSFFLIAGVLLSSCSTSSKLARVDEDVEDYDAVEIDVLRDDDVNADGNEFSDDSLDHDEATRNRWKFSDPIILNSLDKDTFNRSDVTIRGYKDAIFILWDNDYSQIHKITYSPDNGRAWSDHIIDLTSFKNFDGSPTQFFNPSKYFIPLSETTFFYSFADQKGCVFELNGGYFKPLCYTPITLSDCSIGNLSCLNMKTIALEKTKSGEIWNILLFDDQSQLINFRSRLNDLQFSDYMILPGLPKVIDDEKCLKSDNEPQILTHPQEREGTFISMPDGRAALFVMDSFQCGSPKANCYRIIVYPAAEWNNWLSPKVLSEFCIPYGYYPPFSLSPYNSWIRAAVDGDNILVSLSFPANHLENLPIDCSGDCEQGIRAFYIQIKNLFNDDVLHISKESVQFKQDQWTNYKDVYWHKTACVENSGCELVFAEFKENFDNNVWSPPFKVGSIKIDKGMAGTPSLLTEILKYEFLGETVKSQIASYLSLSERETYIDAVLYSVYPETEKTRLLHLNYNKETSWTVKQIRQSNPTATLARYNARISGIAEDGALFITWRSGDYGYLNSLVFNENVTANEYYFIPASPTNVENKNILLNGTLKLFNNYLYGLYWKQEFVSSELSSAFSLMESKVVYTSANPVLNDIPNQIYSQSIEENSNVNFYKVGDIDSNNTLYFLQKTNHSGNSTGCDAFKYDHSAQLLTGPSTWHDQYDPNTGEEFVPCPTIIAIGENKTATFHYDTSIFPKCGLIAKVFDSINLKQIDEKCYEKEIHYPNRKLYYSAGYANGKYLLLGFEELQSAFYRLIISEFNINTLEIKELSSIEPPNMNDKDEIVALPFKILLNNKNQYLDLVVKYSARKKDPIFSEIIEHEEWIAIFEFNPWNETGRFNYDYFKIAELKSYKWNSKSNFQMNAFDSSFGEHAFNIEDALLNDDNFEILYTCNPNLPDPYWYFSNEYVYLWRGKAER